MIINFLLPRVSSVLCCVAFVLRCVTARRAAPAFPNFNDNLGLQSMHATEISCGQKKGRCQMSDEKDIERIREEEIERGRRPRHAAEKDKRRRLKSLMMTALQKGNRGLFQQVLIDLGKKPGSADYEEWMREYEKYQRERR